MTYLFISGCPRSGTTAMAKILNRHSRIIIGLERYKFVIVEDLNNFNSKLFTFDRFLNISKLETNINPDNAMWINKYCDFYNIIKSKYWAVKNGNIGEDDMIWGDKFPYYYKEYRKIKNNFQSHNVKWIFMARKINDVALSYNYRFINEETNHSWGGKNHVDAVLDWNESLKETYMFAKENPKDIFICDYERFFSYDPNFFYDMLEFINVDVEDEIKYHYIQECKTCEELKKLMNIVLKEEEKEYIRNNAEFSMMDALLRKSYLW